MNKIITQLIKKRGLGPGFLTPKYEDLSDPFSLFSMDQAIVRLQKALLNREKILIYGDYDADGITASTAMEQTLILAGADPANLEIMLPNRFTDGYGMSPKLPQYAKKQGINLVITVDCGSHNHEIVSQLNKLKIDTIITDHHETEAKLPDAVAVINPHRKDHPTSNLQNLAGVGVVFKVAQALTEKGLIKKGQEKWLLDLVIIGTICDNMLLTGENRILGYYGLIVLSKTRRPGLKELFRSAGIKSLNSEAIGFQLGPRINAAGRLDTADLSLDLLRTQSPTEAAFLVAKLEELNKKRKTEQIFATREIYQRKLSNDPVIIEAGKWHEGIVGIVAGRLLEEYQKPAFVLTEIDAKTYKGSGRSFGDFNLAEALEYAGDVIIGGGGHAGAAGVRVEKSQLEAFKQKINEFYRSLNLKDQQTYFKQSADLTLANFSDLSLDFLTELKSLEPFGPGNEEPIFRLSKIKIAEVYHMGAEGQHLRLDVADQRGQKLKIVAFFAPDQWLSLTPEAQIEPLVKFTENDFNGVRSLEARLIDLNMI